MSYKILDSHPKGECYRFHYSLPIRAFREIGGFHLPIWANAIFLK